MRSDPELNISVSAGVYISDSEGRLLLLLNLSDGKWGPPAGRMLSLETPPHTGVRECFEETGYSVELINLIGIYPFPKDEHNTGIGIAFRGVIVGGTEKLKSDEAIDARYYTEEQIADLITGGQIRHPRYNLPAIKDFFAGCSYPLGVIRR